MEKSITIVICLVLATLIYMDISLTIARIIAFIMPWALPLSIMTLIIGAVIDLVKKKFHWSKFALLFFVITVILLIIEIALGYQISRDILNNP